MENNDIATEPITIVQLPPLTPREQQRALTSWLNWSFVVVILLIFISYILPRFFATGQLEPSAVTSKQLAMMLFATPILFFISLYPIGIYFTPTINIWEKLKLNNAKSYHIPIAIAVAIGVYVGCAIISIGSNSLLELLNIETTKPLVPLLAKECTNANFIMLLFAVIIVAPITEEIVFRRIIYSWLTQHCSKWTAIIITSALFAIVHDSLSIFAALFVLAICFQLIYLKYNSLIPSIIMHACFNSISATLLLLIRIGLIREY
jgi:membrane protease YdiL (CAAX protease family)